MIIAPHAAALHPGSGTTTTAWAGGDDGGGGGYGGGGSYDGGGGYGGGGGYDSGSSDAPMSVDRQLKGDLKQAAKLIKQSYETIQTVPSDDFGDEGTKQARLSAFHVNRAAQDLIEQYFDSASPDVASALHTVDADLEDAAWQLARKPSPDGRFNGVDIPGALADTKAASHDLKRIYEQL